jgi:signal transduction histidine kinase
MGQLPAGCRRGIEAIAESGKRLHAIVESLLIFVRLDQGEVALSREPVDLALALHKVVESFHAKADERKLQLAVEVGEALPQVLADPQELQTALTHLVDNAAKFTPAGGRVTVAAKPTVEPDGRLAVEIAVRDTGIGIPPHLHVKVFERFYQVDGSLTRKFGGVGIGLAVVKQIIEAHGSHVVLESESGKGSTFRFVLPAAD